MNKVDYLLTLSRLLSKVNKVIEPHKCNLCKYRIATCGAKKIKFAADKYSVLSSEGVKDEREE